VCVNVFQDTGLLLCVHVEQAQPAGTYGGHAGEQSDSRMISHAEKRGIKITSRSRKIRESDLDSFDLIVGMDDSNIFNIKSLINSPSQTKKIVKMTDFCVNQIVSEVPDPYYGGSQGFETVLDILEDACENLLNQIVAGKI